MGERVGIALGANLGERLATLAAARDRLRDLAVAGAEFRQSSVYATEPVGCPDGSPDFYNAVIELSYAGEPLELLAATQAIEAGFGRLRTGERNAPRPLDIDLLYFGNRELRESRLELPHPRLAERKFVLVPLAQIRPDLLLPGQVDKLAILRDGLRTNEAEPREVAVLW
ncbi:MAG: 2-amino-4-hydroxy-6-hydroxymethyldihydropteridine diphosphokinase [Verrucomicrobiales bacterium]